VFIFDIRTFNARPELRISLSAVKKATAVQRDKKFSSFQLSIPSHSAR